MLMGVFHFGKGKILKHFFEVQCCKVCYSEELEACRRKR